MTQSEAFIAQVDEFLARSEMTPTAFGRAAVNDPNFVADIRNGRKPNLGLVDRVHAFMRSHEQETAA